MSNPNCSSFEIIVSTCLSQRQRERFARSQAPWPSPSTFTTASRPPDDYQDFQHFLESSQTRSLHSPLLQVPGSFPGITPSSTPSTVNIDAESNDGFDLEAGLKDTLLEGTDRYAPYSLSAAKGFSSAAQDELHQFNAAPPECLSSIPCGSLTCSRHADSAEYRQWPESDHPIFQYTVSQVDDMCGDDNLSSPPWVNKSKKPSLPYNDTNSPHTDYNHLHSDDIHSHLGLNHHVIDIPHCNSQSSQGGSNTADTFTVDKPLMSNREFRPTFYRPKPKSIQPSWAKSLEDKVEKY
ncbi:uncharacterized protein L201_002213 [Kwoniella dendrophila CBS 6074]|uniref:Uncharacterized protein n=1 Tax=Kwoniella dendrophila CBS 6074 TaxID=1295534 RepID=A0AAX4JRH2_9TREE